MKYMGHPDRLHNDKYRPGYNPALHNLTPVPLTAIYIPWVGGGVHGGFQIGNFFTFARFKVKDL